ncbi:HIT family protein [Archaeoglobales archaeon]|nr:MAG: HIT family protein [Archaeoglobales archaeon]
MDCVFCEIIAGKKDCFKIYEDENVLAFLDINPVVEGHTLVMPKRHVERLEDLSDEEAVFVLRAIKRVVKLLLKKLQADGYNVVVNAGRIAGQEILHLHFHVFPRKSGDGGLFTPKEIDLERVYRKIMD